MSAVDDLKERLESLPPDEQERVDRVQTWLMDELFMGPDAGKGYQSGMRAYADLMSQSDFRWRSLLLQALRQLMKECLHALVEIQPDTEKETRRRLERRLLRVATILAIAKPPELESLALKLFKFSSLVAGSAGMAANYAAQCATAYPVRRDNLSSWEGLLEHEGTAMLALRRLMTYAEESSEHSILKNRQEWINTVRQKSERDGWKVSSRILDHLQSRLHSCEPTESKTPKYVAPRSAVSPRFSWVPDYFSVSKITSDRDLRTSGSGPRKLPIDRVPTPRTVYHQWLPLELDPILLRASDPKEKQSSNCSFVSEKLGEYLRPLNSTSQFHDMVA